MCSQREFLKIKTLILRQVDKQPLRVHLYSDCEQTTPKKYIEW